MRLLFISQDFPPTTGGIQTYSFELSKRLSKLCEYFCVLAPKSKHSKRYDITSDFDIKRFRVPNSAWLLFPLMVGLQKMIRENNIDTLFHSQWQTLGPSIKAKQNKENLKICCAAHARELLINPGERFGLGNFYHKRRLRFIGKVDQWYAVSDYTKSLLIDMGVNPEKIEVLINGTDPDFFYPKEVHDLKEELNLSSKKIILTLTRLVERKGIDLVLKILPDILKKYPDAHYLIVGDGEHKETIENLIDELGIKDSVTLTGKIPYSELNDYYNLCDVFVMPSKTEVPDVEGFGIVFLEANACEKPVIGSNSGGIPSAIKDGYNGLIVKEQNLDELKHAIISLITDSEKAKKFGENGRNFVLNEANWDTISNQLFEHLKTL